MRMRTNFTASITRDENVRRRNTWDWIEHWDVQTDNEEAVKLPSIWSIDKNVGSRSRIGSIRRRRRVSSSSSSRHRLEFKKQQIKIKYEKLEMVKRRWVSFLK